MSINERSVALRSGTTSYTTLKDFMDRRRVIPLPFDETATVAVSAANFVLIDASMTVATKLAIGEATTTNGGLFATILTGAVGTGDASKITSDSLGNILNMVSIRDEVTHNSVTTDDGFEVFALVQAVSTASDGDTILAAASENAQLSFVYNSGAGALTLTAITATIEFAQNNAYIERQTPTIMLQSGNPDQDIIASISLDRAEFDVTTAFIADEVITLSTGAGDSSGASTVTGETVALGASAIIFNANNLLTITVNGVEQLKGVDVVWDSNLTMHFAVALDIADIFQAGLLAN